MVLTVIIVIIILIMKVIRITYKNHSNKTYIATWQLAMHKQCY